VVGLERNNVVTFVVVLSPSSTLTPAAITSKTLALALPVTVKETCYGMLIEGEKEAAEKVVEEIRKLDPNNVFVKVRGFPIGDPRICRAKRLGGSRLGFPQLEGENELLPLISHALEKYPSCRIRKEPEGRMERFPVAELKKLIKTMELS